METRKAMTIIGGTGLGALIVGLILGFIFFDDGSKVDLLEEKVSTLEQEKAELEKSWKEKLASSTSELEQQNEQLESELAKTRKDLGNKVKDLTNKLTIANEKIALQDQRFKSEATRLEEQIKQLQERQISGPDLPALIDELNRMWPAYIGFSVRGLELKNSLANARVATPDIERVQKAAEDVLAYVSDYKDNILRLRQHVKMVRPELDKIGIDPALILKLFSENVDRTVKNLAEHVNAITERISVKKGRVEASKGFVDIPVKLDKGDLLFFDYEGSWQMSSDRGMGSAGGWDDVPNHMKFAADAPGGSLVFKVGVSDEVLPAFGRQPKIAPEAGLLRVGINDKVLDDNVGYIDVTVSRVPGRELKAFEEFWEEQMAPIVHWTLPTSD